MDGEPGPVPDRSALMRMATAYLARYAASSHRLRSVLERRIHRRCARGGLASPDPAALQSALDDLLQRLADMGLIDDRSVAAGRVRSLQRKGFGERRIRMALSHEGLGADAIDSGDNPIDDHAQAQRFAARKRLGPYRAGARGPFRDKDLRSLQRAGFAYSVARAVVDAEQAEPDGDPE